MAVTGFRSTINYRVIPVIQISSEPHKITEVFVSSHENYDIFLEMPYLNCHQVVIDCRKATIMFPKTGYVLQCQKGIQALYSVPVIPEYTPNVFQEFSKILSPKKLTILPPLREVNQTITLRNTKTDSNPSIFTVLDNFISKYEEAITKWKVVDIIYPSACHNPVNIFLKLRSIGEIRPLADLVPHNKIMVKDQEPIAN
jgi:hypothetical protein